MTETTDAVDLDRQQEQLLVTLNELTLQVTRNAFDLHTMLLKRQDLFNKNEEKHNDVEVYQRLEKTDMKQDLAVLEEKGLLTINNYMYTLTDKGRIFGQDISKTLVMNNSVDVTRFNTTFDSPDLKQKITNYV